MNTDTCFDHNDYITFQLHKKTPVTVWICWLSFSSIVANLTNVACGLLASNSTSSSFCFYFTTSSSFCCRCHALAALCWPQYKAMKTASTAAVLGSNCDNKTTSTATALWTINLRKCTQLLKQSAFLSRTDVCTQSTPHQLRTAYSIRCKISSLVLRHSAVSSRKLP